MRKVICFCSIAVLTVTAVAAQDEAVAPEGAKLIAEGYEFPEGPVVDSEGTLYFSDVRGNKILRWNGSTTETFLEDTKGANGLAFDKKGNLFACRGEGKDVVKISPGGEMNVVADSADGKELNSPNDLVFGLDGTIYFTNPGRGGLPSGVIRVNPDGKAQMIGSEPAYPNGIGMSPDGNWLYVNDTMNRSTIWRYELKDDGTVGAAEEFAQFGRGGPDGLAIAASGNLYIAMNLGAKVTVLSPGGETLEEFQFGRGSGVTNVCFGGPDWKTLYITLGNAGTVYSLEVDEPGLKPYSHR